MIQLKMLRKDQESNLFFSFMCYGYDLNEKEKVIVKACYESILTKTFHYIKSLQNNTIFEDFFTCVFLLFDGFFSDKHIFIRSNEYKYVFFQNISYSLYPFNGIGCCRHTNELLFLIFQKLGYEGKEVFCELQNGQKSSEIYCNHIILMSEIDHRQYFFDLINWNIGILQKHEVFSWHPELSYRFTAGDENVNVSDLSFINLCYKKIYQKLSEDCKNLMFLYASIQPELQEISGIIKKYENYASLHIRYVYE